MRVNLNISTKLLLIMTSTLSLVLVAAAIGWLGFAQVADKQSSLVDEAVPAMMLSHRLNSANTQLLFLAPKLIQPSSQASLNVHVENLQQQLNLIASMAKQYQTFAAIDGMEQPLQSLTDDIGINLTQQRILAEQYLTEKSRFEEHHQTAVIAVTNIYQISTSLVANANTITAAMASSLYDLAGGNDAVLYSGFDRLIDVDLDHLERMYELRKVAGAMRNFIDPFPHDAALLDNVDLPQQSEQLLSTLERRIEDINDPGRRRQASANLLMLTNYVKPFSTNNIFSQQSKVLSLLDQQMQLAEQMKALLASFNSQVLLVSDQISSHMRQASDEAEQAVYYGRNLLIVVCLLFALVGIFFLWFYLRNKLFARLDKVNQALLSVAQGDLNVELSYMKDDELGRLARTVEVFKDNALVRQELEQQKDLVAKRLHRYQVELEEQIQSRTSDLQKLNDQLQASSKHHQQAREEAEQANRAKTDFLAILSHEIRTPLSGMLGTLQLLQMTEKDPQQQKYVDLSIQSAEALLLILKGILDYAKIEGGYASVDAEAINLNKVAASVQAIITPLVQNKSLSLSLEVDARLTQSLVITDQVKLHQILFNLLSNAIKFTHSGSITLQVLLKEDRAEPWFQCRVADTGLGIPETKRQQLFQPFTQYDSSTARRFGGIGLGLPICQKLITLMGGRMGISSRIEGDYAQGTCIWFELPFEFSEELPSHQDPVAAQQQKLNFKLLVVEDNEIGRTVAEGMLKHLGHEVTMVTSGYEALDYADEFFDMIFMDISMPSMDGVETTLRLRKAHQKLGIYVPVIAMSAHIFSQEVEEFLRAGMDGFIGKPLDMVRIQEVIINIHHKQRELISMPQLATPQVLNESILADDLAVLGPARMQALIDLFKDTIKQQLHTIEQAYQQSMWIAITDEAHAMKSAAGSMGMEKLYQLSSQLENQARQRQSNSISLIIEDLSPLIDESLRLLAVWHQSVLG